MYESFLFHSAKHQMDALHSPQKSHVVRPHLQGCPDISPPQWIASELHLQCSGTVRGMEIRELTACGPPLARYANAVAIT